MTLIKFHGLAAHCFSGRRIGLTLVLLLYSLQLRLDDLHGAGGLNLFEKQRHDDDTDRDGQSHDRQYPCQSLSIGHTYGHEKFVPKEHEPGNGPHNRFEEEKKFIHCVAP